MMGFLCLIVCSFILLVPCSSQTLDQGIQLMTDTLTGYDRRLRPVLNQSMPIQVAVTFDLIGLKDFDEVKEQFSVTGLFLLTWTDEKLTWNSSSYGGIDEQVFSIKDIWYPVLVLTNPAKDMKDIVKDWMTVRVYPNGLAVFYPGAMFDASCSIDVTYYPFDIQTCMLSFIPWGMTFNDMRLVSTSDTITQNYFTENGEWTFIELDAKDDLDNNNNALYFTFKMKRKPMFVLINTILPIVFMAVISVFVFVLPPESGERLSFSITVLLAIAVFFTIISDNLPKTSNPLSHMSYFLTIILSYSTLMSIIAVFNLRVYFKSESTRVPSFLAYIVQVAGCKRPTIVKSIKTISSVKQHRNQVDIIDMVCNEKTPIEEPEVEDVTSQEANVTWKEVSAFIDTICIILFSLAICITCIVYLVILTSNQ